ncbi:MAG: alpha/beta fold hydrolase, partial [Solirubrobacteraceae bacterium]
GEEPRRAGVSAFGMSGTNAHMIIEEAPLVPDMIGDQADPAGDGQRSLGLVAAGTAPWILSGKGADALRAQSARLGEWLRDRPELEPLDVGLSLASTRSAFERRAVIVGATRERMLDGLHGLAGGEAISALVEGSVDGYGSRTVFVFPGHGSQWAGMGSELLDRSPVFAAHIEACERALAPHIEWSLTDVLREAPDAPSLERIDVAQPLLFAMMVSLAGLWRACGVSPDAVVGHSQGEIAAAHVAGALSLDDAARLVARRSRVLASLTGKGRMASIGLGAEELAARLAERPQPISIAAANGPSSTVVSGEPEALRSLLSDLAGEGVRVREVAGALGAGHSPQIDPLRERLLEACSPIAPSLGEVAFYSTVTAKRLETAALDPSYWFRNAREPVRFEGAIRRLLEDGFRTYVEVSPHPVLSGAITDTIDELEAQPGEARVLGSLRRGEGGAQRFLTSLGEAWAHGVTIDWGAVFAGSGATRVSLPTYSFQRKHYWFTPEDQGRQGVSLSGADSGVNSSLPSVERGGSLLRRQLQDAVAQEHTEIISRTVRDQVAAVLGDVSPDSIDLDKSLLELGFDSTAAVELRGRLNSVSGLRIPTRVILDRPTPGALVVYIGARLAELMGEGGEEPDATFLEQVALPSEQDDEPGMLVGMLRDAHERGALDQFIGTLMTTSKFRPAFDTVAEDRMGSELVALSSGEGAIELICLPTVLASSGAHQYVKFAKALGNSCAVSAFALPGFVRGERLPETLEVLLEDLALSVERRDGEAPFALVGYSSGGWLAHALASRLERGGKPAEALVLIDAQPPTGAPSSAVLQAALAPVFDSDVYEFLNDDRLMAMGAYLRLLVDWRPAEIGAPTLLVVAEERLADQPASDEWPAPKALPNLVVDISGDHFTLLEDHVAGTAAAVEEWLLANCGGYATLPLTDPGAMPAPAMSVGNITTNTASVKRDRNLGG